MVKKLSLVLFLLVQTSCVVLLPFVEDDSVEIQQESVCKAHTEYRAPIRINKIDFALRNLRSNNDATRTSAATDLGFYGDNRPMVVEALKTASWKDRSKWVRRAAVKSLYKLAGRDAIPSLKVALRDSDPWVVHSAQQALAKLR